MGSHGHQRFAATCGMLAPLASYGGHVGALIILVSVLAFTIRKTAPYAQQIFREWNIRTVIKTQGSKLTPEEAAALISRLTAEQLSSPGPIPEARPRVSWWHRIAIRIRRCAARHGAENESAGP